MQETIITRELVKAVRKAKVNVRLHPDYKGVVSTIEIDLSQCNLTSKEVAPLTNAIKQVLKQFTQQ